MAVRFFEDDKPRVRFLDEEDIQGIRFIDPSPTQEAAIVAPPKGMEAFKMKARTFLRSGEIGKPSVPPLEAIKQVLFPTKQRYDKADESERLAIIAAQSFLNTRAFGMPNYIANKLGVDIVKPKTGKESVVAGAGSLMGFIKGPAKFGGKIAEKIPFLKGAKTIPGVIAKKTLRSAASLGFASASIIPEDDFIGFAERAEAFREGAKMGAVFGGISFIPSTPIRMLTSSGAFGVPSTLQNEPIESQIFNYGIGAWFGREGGKPSVQLAKEKSITKIISEGFNEKNSERFLTENDGYIKAQKKHNQSIGIDIVTPKERINNILGRWSPQDPFTPLLKILGPKGKQYAARARKNEINKLWGRLKEVKAKSETALYEGDVDFLLDNIRTRKSIEQLGNTQIKTFQELLRSENLPSVDNMMRSEPLARDRGLNLWDAMLRPGYKVLDKLGFGNFQQEGLTQSYFESDVNRAIDIQNHHKIKANWIRTVGTNKKTATKLFKYLDGKLNMSLLTSKEKKVAGQIRSYLDNWLEAQNRHRVSWGEKPIEARDNYITHIFDSMLQSAQQSKHPFSQETINAFDYIIPTQKRSQFLIKRKGAIGYKQNVWEALDAYVTASSSVVNDTPVRKSNKVIRYLNKEMRVNEKIGAESLFNLPDIRKNLTSFVRDYVGTQRPFDVFLSNTLKDVNKVLPEGMQINNINQLSGLITSSAYGMKMGYRPKLALRNMGQHSLIIGEVGMKPLAGALKKYRTLPTGKLTPEGDQILTESKVLKSRSMAFAPETINIANATDAVRRETTRSLLMYRGADRINVENSFLAGYTEAINKGLSKPEAIKRGDQVAAKTQFIYLRGNRSHLARSLLGLSKTGGRVAGMFSTWSPNWLELQMSWAKAGHRESLLRYAGINGVALGLMGALGIATFQYTGINSVSNLISMAKSPIGRLKNIFNLDIGLVKDLEKVAESGDLRDLFLYTFYQD